MKTLFLFLTIIAFSFNSIAQGNSQGKGKSKTKHKTKTEKVKHVKDHDNDDDHDKVKDKVKVKDRNDDVNETTKQKGYSKNQPKKVQAALLRDYPNATNVVWSKYKGDYTATFTNGIYRSTAVYHANGDRRDTRTPLTRDQLPGTIWDRVFTRDNITPTTYVQIERPSTTERIFRILTGNNTPYYYDQNGNRIKYNY